MLFESAPVAAVHGGIVADVERAGDDLAVALGEHQTKMRREAPMQLVEKFLRQILAAVIEPVDVVFVQPKHRAHVVLRQLVALVGANRNAPLRHFAPLALDLVAPVAAKAAEIVVEGSEIAVLPMELNAHAREKTHLFERLALVGETEIYVHRRDLIVGGDLRQRLSHEANQLQRGLRPRRSENDVR